MRSEKYSYRILGDKYMTKKEREREREREKREKEKRNKDNGSVS
jgi:hypothetical protein